MKVAIVNDLLIAQKALLKVIQEATHLSVGWIASDGNEAIRYAKEDPVDVILMDLVMPNKDGVHAIKEIMETSPCIILIVTASLEGNQNRVFEAMGYGAMDVVQTPSVISEGFEVEKSELVKKIYQVGRMANQQPSQPEWLDNTKTNSTVHETSPELPPLVVMGASTGGPQVLQTLISGLNHNYPAAIIIVQHIDEAFVEDLVHWLSTSSKIPVLKAEAGKLPEPAKVYVAATNKHLILDQEGRFQFTIEPQSSFYHPSIDVFFESLVNHKHTAGLAILLTGMGQDGAMGLLRLSHNNWVTVAQDEESSVVYGMPKAAVEMNAAIWVEPVEGIQELLESFPEHLKKVNQV